MISHEGEELSTFLSETVYDTIVNLRNTSEPSTSCLTQDFLIDWNKIDYTLGNISECGNVLDYSNEWFLEKNKLLWSIINSIGKDCNDFCVEEKFNFESISFWFDDGNGGERILTKFLSFGDNELLLCLLIITSRIERVLGNVYAISGKEVPFLLKDLLASDVLKEKLGKTQVSFLQLLLGCVHGLNLRNIAWHGFFSPGELHVNIIATLVITLATLRDQLKNLDIPRRPYIKYDSIQKHSEALRPFYFSLDFDSCSFETAVMECVQIPSMQRQYWIYSFDLFLNGSFGDSLIFMLPLLESLLRGAFCSANQCPKRILTAESTVFYTTMDDILASKIPTEGNKIGNFMGEKLLEMFLDLFVYQEGPRLRDRISHAEIITTNISESIAKHTFGIALCLMLTISKGLEVHYEGLFLELMKVPQKYQPLFHPSSILKSSLMKSVQIVKSWSNLPFPEHLRHSVHDEDYFKLKNALSKTTECDFSNISDLLEITKNELVHTFPSTLYRPKYELELVFLLRKITENIGEFDQNISLNFHNKYEHWNRKTMKSRVRDNYKRMINFLPLIQLTFGSVAFLMAKTLKSLHSQDENGVKVVQRFFKYCLQFVENGVSMSDMKKNRWNELRESSITLCNLILEKYSYFNCTQ